MNRYDYNYEELKDYCEKLEIELENSIKLNKANTKSYEKLWYKVEAYKQTLMDIKEIVEEQIFYLDIDKPKTMIELEYNYAGKIWDLEQKMHKILQKLRGI